MFGGDRRAGWCGVKAARPASAASTTVRPAARVFMTPIETSSLLPVLLDEGLGLR